MYLNTLLNELKNKKHGSCDDYNFNLKSINMVNAVV